MGGFGRQQVMQASFDQVHYAVTPKIKHMYNLCMNLWKCIYLTAVTWANIYLYFWIVYWLKFSKGQEETKKKFLIIVEMGIDS